MDFPSPGSAVPCRVGLDSSKGLCGEELRAFCPFTRLSIVLSSSVQPKRHTPPLKGGRPQARAKKTQKKRIDLITPNYNAKLQALLHSDPGRARATAATYILDLG